MDLKQLREYAGLVRREAFFEDAEDYEPGRPLAGVVGESTGDVAVMRAKIASGDYPAVLQIAADIQRKGTLTMDLEAQRRIAWSLLNWYPARDFLNSCWEDDSLVNLVLARQAIALGSPEAVPLTDTLVRRFPDIPHLQTLRRIAQSACEPDAKALRALRAEVELSDDMSLSYSLALVECRYDRERGIERLEKCVKARPYVPGYLGRLMWELMNDRRWEDTMRVFAENQELGSRFYVCRRSALLTRGAIEGAEAIVEELWTMYKDHPYDRLLELNLSHILKTRRAYIRLPSLLFRFSRAFLRAWPNELGRGSGQEGKAAADSGGPLDERRSI